jgi:hypothetical protein
MTLPTMLGFLLLFLGVSPSQSRIEVTASVTWTTSRSLSEQVVIDNRVTLTIKGDDPTKPIVIDLDDKENVGGGFKIFPEATLILENVILTRSKNLGINIDAVSFVQESGGFVSMNNVRCEKMTNCIVRFCCDGNQVIVKDSTFYNNTVALNGHGRVETIKTSLFVENEMALSGANWIMQDCVFLRNQQASNAKNAQFIRTLFIENDKGVQDPNGYPNPFLQDCLFFRNRHAILPSSTTHASMSQVSLIENQVAIYCSSKLSTLNQVNFINNTEWNAVYSGNESSDVGASVYWGTTDLEGILTKNFDSNQGSKGGAIVVTDFAKEPYLHDLVITMLKKQPTTLLNGLGTYFANMEQKILQTLTTAETAFDFTKLQEWAAVQADLQLDNNSKEPIDTSSANDSGNHVIPQAVTKPTNPPAGGQPTPVPQSASQPTPVPPAASQLTPLPPAASQPTPVHKATIQVQDDDNAILFISVAFNICFFWIISVLLYEYCCRPRWRAKIAARAQADTDEEVQLMEQEGWISYKDDPIPKTNGVPKNRSAAYRVDPATEEVGWGQGNDQSAALKNSDVPKMV